jgi:TrmH family RNA methyltransferase
MITSRHNPKIQTVRGLLRQPGERAQSGTFVVEGVRLAEEAAQAGWQPQQVFYTETLSPRGRAVLEVFSKSTVDLEQLSPSVMEYLSETETSQGLLAVFPLRALPLPKRMDFLLVLDTIRDPGNLGTLLRTAAAAGVQAVAAMPGTADPFSPKVVRAAMGAHFRLPILSLDWPGLQSLGNSLPGGGNIKFYLAEASEGEVCWEADLRSPLALIVCNEAEGATAEARQVATTSVRIPMPGQFESLNAAIAGAILMFEVVRQRGSKAMKQ